MKLQLHLPLKETSLNQAFGVNGAYYQANGINIKGHNGLDFQAKHGEPVYAAHDGYAYFEWDSGQGEGVVIRSKEAFELADGSTSFIKTIYWHLCDAVKEPQFKSPITNYDINSQGQEVKAGDLIGYADSTGFSTGDHLHFGLKPISAGESLGALYNPLQNNGYQGAIDPLPYLTNFANMPFKFNKDMAYGETSNDVKELQKRLIHLGYIIPSGATGYYGKETAAAVVKYQIASAIPLTFAQRYLASSSVVGPKTRASLNSA